ncbi:MAG: hypothetical protein ABR579_04960, partial [Actinomycetota bacterium]
MAATLADGSNQPEGRAQARQALRRSLTPSDVAGRRQELEELAKRSDDPHVSFELAGLCYLSYDFDISRSHAEAAFLAFKKAGHKRAAAVAAALIGRIFFEGFDNAPAANGWFARARTMLEGEGPCLEKGWVLLGLVGCSVGDAAKLLRDADEALDIARRFDNAELECKALGDAGVACVGLGEIDRGFDMIDEAMTMLTCEDIGYFVAAQVLCDTVTACERSGDLGRLERWLEVLDVAGVAGPDDFRPLMFTHCHVAYGNVLCGSGRWSEAESALRLGLATSQEGFGYHRTGSRSGLAELRIRQGRYDEARIVLEGCPDRVEVAPARARLHHAEGRYDEAISTIAWCVRQLGQDDRARAVP